MNIAKSLEKELKIKEWQINATIDLIDQGNTIPFIARYRKEATGSLDDEVLRKFNERLNYLRKLEDRKETILKSIEEQGKLTEDIKNKINKSDTLIILEDIYRPFKPKKKTRASIAKEKGLEGLATIIMEQKTKTSLEEMALEYLSEKKEVKTVEEAIQGAKDIIAENISDNPQFRQMIRDLTFKRGMISTKYTSEKTSSTFSMYENYEESLKKIANHRILAINRGEKKKELKVKIIAPEDRIIKHIQDKTISTKFNEFTNPILIETIEDSYKRLIAPSIEREIRSEITEKAEEKSIKVFSNNLNQLLMQPPILDKVVLGWDPAFRTGCKIAVVNGIGKVLETSIVFPTEPQNDVEKTKKIINKLIKKHSIDLIALGNGTASRESEEIIAEIISESEKDIKYVIVNEAGASVYSASKLASEEFPNYNVGERSAISIARRLQDPLSELVKIDPKSIGVGQYQHDMNQKKLNEALNGVIEKVVNSVGVDLNTASASLLNHISGISKNIAKNIVEYRENEGKFKNRKELLKVAKLGPKTYQQCAGFLRVNDSDNPLDSTSVHPESYDVTNNLLKKMNYDLDNLKQKSNQKQSKDNHLSLSKEIDDFEKLAQELGVGEITLKDIVNELEKPSRDPRKDMPKIVLRKDVLNIEDLKVGMVLNGTIRNVIDFGAFVDIGVHQDGLVHISQLTANKFVNHPLEIVSIGDVVEVKIIDIDLDRKRVQLSMKDVD